MTRPSEPRADADADADADDSFEASVRRVLLATEAGDVLTYGDVADAAGFPGAHRAVGTLLRRTEGLPWWRVVTATGRLVPGSETRHASLLRDEGIPSEHGRITRRVR